MFLECDPQRDWRIQISGAGHVLPVRALVGRFVLLHALFRAEARIGQTYFGGRTPLACSRANAAGVRPSWTRKRREK